MTHSMLIMVIFVTMVVMVMVMVMIVFIVAIFIFEHFHKCEEFGGIKHCIVVRVTHFEHCFTRHLIIVFISMSVSVPISTLFCLGFNVFTSGILQVVLVALKFNRNMLSVNGQARDSCRVHCERGIIATTNMKIEA